MIDDSYAEADAEDEYLYGDPAYDDDADCTLCAGEGYDECYDPIQCCATHSPGGLCPCIGCGGSGLGKDQTIW